MTQKTKFFTARHATLTTAALLITSLLPLAGCKAKPAIADDALTTGIQNQLAGDSALGGQQIAVTVQNGVATLNGVVANDAQRSLAARDAAAVAGVQQVQNALVVGVAGASVTAAAPAPIPLKPAPGLPALETRRQQDRDQNREQDRRRDDHQQAPVERQSPPPQQTYNQPAPPQPSAPPPPSFKTVTLQAGDAIPVRVTQTLDSATSQQGQAFSGVVASDIVIDGVVAIPAGSNVSGQVDDVKDATHFKGSSSLTVSIGSITRRGDRIAVSTEPYTLEGKGRGKNTAEKAGIGAVGGAILGGIFGGGKGAAIGAAAGGGAGAGVNAITRGQQVQIPSETVVRFRLNAPVTVRVRTDRNDGDQRHPLQ